MGALNFITTLIDLRAKGMTLGRLPLTCWTWLVTAILGLLAFGVLLAACILLPLDRIAGTSFAIPGGPVITDPGGHLAQGRLPSAMAARHLGSSATPRCTSQSFRGWAWRTHLLSTFFAQAGIWLPRHGQRLSAASASWASCVGATATFVSGMSPYSAFAFSILTMTIGVPSAIKTFNWLGTIWGGKIQFNCAMLFALGFVSLSSVSGGLSGLFLAQPSLIHICTIRTS